MSTTPEQEIQKIGANSLREVAKHNGPWAVLFIIVIVVATLYVYSEKKDCADELKEVRKEMNEARQSLGRTQVELAECKGTLSTTTITNSQLTTSKKR